ncbi:MAG: DUF116 domain-containing protein [Methanobacteriota archaeon]|nr:MAG: DUF116 domain-containing protein [Euryarchaeota archaeon]
MFYELLGRITFLAVMALAALLLVSLILGILLVKKKRILLPKILLFTVDHFYFQLKKVASMFGVRESIVDQIGIELRNTLGAQSFAMVEPKDRILVVPQCLRHPKCPARLDSTEGILCKECGLCVVKDLKGEAERLGYRFYTVPGGRFVERIVKRVRPKAALGVACYKDLNMAMHELSRSRFAVQGVPLVRDGCVGTEVNLREVFERMRLGIEDAVASVSPCEEKTHLSGR